MERKDKHSTETSTETFHQCTIRCTDNNHGNCNLMYTYIDFIRGNWLLSTRKKNDPHSSQYITLHLSHYTHHTIFIAIYSSHYIHHTIFITLHSLHHTTFTLKQRLIVGIIHFFFYCIGQTLTFNSFYFVNKLKQNNNLND